MKCTILDCPHSRHARATAMWSSSKLRTSATTVATLSTAVERSLSEHGTMLSVLDNDEVRLLALERPTSVSHPVQVRAR